ncbi:MAG: DNA-binding protein [Legionellales bacterium]|nr:DNA-binding protein [Legionellales bacterium]
MANNVSKRAKRSTSAVAKAFTKSEILSAIAEQVGITKKQVGEVMDELTTIIERHVKKRSIGEFTLPGLLKIKVATKPATKARKGVNPFNGKEIMIKAKPARKAVKVKPLRKLKEMVE